MDGSARERWNARYRERGDDPGAPSDWLVENRALIGGTRALDLACGAGRNARYLAGLGFTVDAIDISDVAIAALQGIDGVQARAVDLESEPLPAGAYDVVLMINYLQRGLFAAAADALAPGGVLLAETVTRAHVDQLGRAFDSRFLLEPGELRDAFPDLHVLRFEEGVVQRSGRPRAVAAIVAKRPSALVAQGPAELVAQRPG